MTLTSDPGRFAKGAVCSGGGARGVWGVSPPDQPRRTKERRITHRPWRRRRGIGSRSGEAEGGGGGGGVGGDRRGGRRAGQRPVGVLQAVSGDRAEDTAP